MPLNKIGGGSNLQANAVPIPLGPGGVFALPAGQGIVGTFGAIVTPQLGTNNPLSGQFIVQLGPYSTLQVYDPGLNYWRNVNVQVGQEYVVSSDGTNFRIANTTGAPVGAIITAAGSGGVNGFYGYNNQRQAITIVNGITTLGNTVFTITPSAGGSLWNAIVGGLVNATISFSGTVFQNGPFGGTGTSQTASAGSGYLAPPLIVFGPPPNQGQQPYVLPQAICAITSGAISSVTMTQQGAGLLGLPSITVVPQFGDTTGGGAILGWLSGNSSQVNSAAASLMWPSFYGTGLTAVPTFSYGGTASPGPTATAIMNFSMTGVTNTTPGVGYTNAYAVMQGGIVAGTPANNSPGNPFYDKGLSPLPIFPPLSVVAGTGVTTLANPSFGGVNMQAIPSIAFGTQLAAGTVTTVAVQTPIVGGNNDVCMLISL